MGKSHNISN